MENEITIHGLITAFLLIRCLFNYMVIKDLEEEVFELKRSFRSEKSSAEQNIKE